MIKEKEPTINGAGHLSKKANGWAQQREQDLNTLNNTEEGEETLRRISPMGRVNFKKFLAT